MTTTQRLMSFPEDRVLEDAAFGQGIVPARLYALLLPVWQVEIRADVTEGEDFFLIDRFLGRGLRHGGLHTVDELATFFALDHALVAQAVRFLTAIGHVREAGGRLSLTSLGQRSVDDDIRYVVTRQDRRKLYFEALSCTPLTRAHYDEEVVTLLSGDGLSQATRNDHYPRFTPLHVTSGFDRTALERLKNRKDRVRFNLPVALDALESLDEQLVFLPVYLVRGRKGLLVYGQAGAGSAHDPELSELCARTPELTHALDNEEKEDEADERVQRAARNFLREHEFTSVAPEQDDDGTWSVSLPATAFGDNGLPVTRIGSYRMVGSRFFRVWCPAETPRKRALLDRLDQRLGSRRHITRQEAEELIARLARQLDLDVPDVSRLRGGAKKTGLSGLEAQLSRLEEEVE
ncbi:hypothetical protein SSP35_10_01940 [Streptomyces sp. NBRC 110611]|uniref:hypothetical protein n=1 Tax=Streptomyces sp. NBRC 110611 TaxID=1621259 RepID=UPI000835F896|nr:hypothetical protein [Streptomyces sp. NBRC 110611]GAU69158.1 hypothetical protein SSP35_10_01940 [Streptomyces sp. NBRC 110611]